MATVFIPTQMRDLTGGVASLEVDVQTLRQLIHHLDEKFPGIAERLVEDDRLAPGIALSIDGEVSSWGLLAKIPSDAEVHFVPAIGGG